MLLVMYAENGGEVWFGVVVVLKPFQCWVVEEWMLQSLCLCGGIGWRVHILACYQNVFHGGVFFAGFLAQKNAIKDVL